MSLVAGTITVSGVDASYTGTGLALVLMDVEVNDFAQLMIAVNMPAASIAAANTLAYKLPRHNRFKAKCEALAAALVTYITANAVVAAGTFNVSGTAIVGTGTVG